jgi:muconate cycloisomerase
MMSIGVRDETGVAPTEQSHAASLGLNLPIELVEIFGVEVPLLGTGFSNAYGITNTQKSAIVRLRSGNGAVGLGNIDPSQGYTLAPIEALLDILRNKLAPLLSGANAANPRAIALLMNRAVDGFPEAKAAIEMACVDLLARHLRIPVHQYLGGATTDRVRFNGWIGLEAPDAAAAAAREWSANGFRSIKVKAGSGIDEDYERLKAVRGAIGREEMRLRVDANAAYSVKDAIALGQAITPFDIQLFEQPCLCGARSRRRVLDRQKGIWHSEMSGPSAHSQGGYSSRHGPHASGCT